MNINTLEARVKELEQTIEQSAANHNGLVGRLMEAKELLSKCHSEALPLAEPLPELPLC